ncbi:hypothetical protein F511_10265 [Dorcoceras hygrometricum]|uniref:Uncharacterized protein n=1 Tax=Dorcoceras hygrometricum TaxID=472368 RepID=A0A2Z7DFT2_9LAMI|nr:hypothetical protein F511_10265 [Dorcoceras hygrometricum]
MSLLMTSSLSAPAELSSSAEHDVVTDYIIIDGPLRCSSWFPFDVPAGSSSSSSACSRFISFQLIHYAPADLSPVLFRDFKCSRTMSYCSSLVVQSLFVKCLRLKKYQLVNRKIFLLILIANAKRCRSNLFKRHRFAIANFKYHLLVDISFLLIVMSLLLTSSLSAQAELSSSAEHDVVTDYIIIDGPLRCSSWFPFDVPAGSSSSSSACSWFISFQLIHYAPAGSTWPLPDFEHLT